MDIPIIKTNMTLPDAEHRDILCHPELVSGSSLDSSLRENDRINFTTQSVGELDPDGDKF